VEKTFAFSQQRKEKKMVKERMILFVILMQKIVAMQMYQKLF
jgi:hypothetical protein